MSPGAPARGLGSRRIADRPPPILHGNETDEQVLNVALEFYCRCAEGNAALQAWLDRIAPDSEAARRAVRLGFVDRSLGLHLPEKNRKAGAVIRGHLREQGIYRDNGREHFRGCVTLVIFDDGGRVTVILGYLVGAMRNDVLPSVSSTGTIPEEYAHRTLGAVLRDLQEEQTLSEPLVTRSPATRASVDADIVAADAAEMAVHAPATSVLTAAPAVAADAAEMAVHAPDANEPPTTEAVPSVVTIMPAAQEQPDAVVLGRAVEHYEATAMKTPHVREFLVERGVGNPRLLEYLRVGYCDRTLSPMLPPRSTPRGAQMRQQWSRIGLLDERGGETLHGCLTMPLTDVRGAVVQMVGHRIGDAADTPRRRYLQGEPRGVLSHETLSTEVVVVESPLDLLTWWAHGFRHVTLLPAPAALGDDLVQALAKAETARVLLALGDVQEGVVDALRDDLVAVGLTAYEVQVPSGFDVTAYARQQGQRAKEALGELLRGAHWLGGTSPVREQVQRPVAPLSTDDPAEGRKEPAAEPLEEVTQRHVTFTFGDRHWRVGGLKKNLGHNSMKVSIFATRTTPDGRDRVFPDALDLQQVRARATFEKGAATELGLDLDTVHQDVGTILLKLDALREEHIRQTLEPKVVEVTLTDTERDEAMALLQQPNLLERIAEDLERCGVVGETVNKQVAYLAATSRKLDRPLAVMTQSSSGAGKSSVMDGVRKFVPDEDVVAFSAVTAQALYYLGNRDLKHKLLSIAEEAGAKSAAYSIKLLQSDGKLSIASTGKDPDTGRVVAVPYEVEGPVSIFMTTTALDVDEELLNRCIVLTVDESREQTRAIHAEQRRAQSLEGRVQARERAKVIALHQNAQRLVEPLMVANPFAEQLEFSDLQTRARRDQPKYFALINTIALLHQHQRGIRTTRVAGEDVRYVEVTRKDIALANTLAHAVLGRSLDELPPQTRKVLTAVHEVLTVECRKQGIPRSEFRFTRRWLRERLSWRDTQLKEHLRRLADLEYVLVHRERDRRQWLYELVYDGGGQDGAPFVAGLKTPSEDDGCEYDVDESNPEGERSGTGRGAVGPRSGPGRST